ncbi:hypothetical protein Plhal304r1_c008g0034151 [Plasmopara halstedii]
MARVSRLPPRLQAYARRGISLVCTSDDTLTRLCNLQLMVCGISVSIRKYSKHDKLYFVDLTRPQKYRSSNSRHWFVEKEARPVLITYVHGQVKSRGCIVYFNSVGCPVGLFESPWEPFREIYCDSEEKPCFVQHKLRIFNRVKPPSLRPHSRRSTESSDARMNGRDVAAEHQIATHDLGEPQD